jgi:hypothetical protein
MLMNPKGPTLPFIKTGIADKEMIMTLTQIAKANQFKALHEGPGAFVVANAWDAGSARILAGLASRPWRHRAALPPASWAGATAR